MNLNFEKHKLTRFINSQGQEYTFLLPESNSFGEPVEGEVSKEVTIRGVYHETQGYVTSKADTGSNIKTKPDAQIICHFSDTKNLKTGMVVQIWEKSYQLIDLRNINNLGVACDLSLELILNG